jgi:hypothetical protein
LEKVPPRWTWVVGGAFTYQKPRRYHLLTIAKVVTTHNTDPLRMKHRPNFYNLLILRIVEESDNEQAC